MWVEHQEYFVKPFIEKANNNCSKFTSHKMGNKEMCHRTKPDVEDISVQYEEGIIFSVTIVFDYDLILFMVVYNGYIQNEKWLFTYFKSNILMVYPLNQKV